MVFGLALLYLLSIILLMPDRMPPLFPGHVIIWCLYAGIVILWVRALKRSRACPVEASNEPSFPSPKTMLWIGAFFILTLPLVRMLLGGVSTLVSVASWSIGALASI